MAADELERDLGLALQRDVPTVPPTDRIEALRAAARERFGENALDGEPIPAAGGDPAVAAPIPIPVPSPSPVPGAPVERPRTTRRSPRLIAAGIAATLLVLAGIAAGYSLGGDLADDGIDLASGEIEYEGPISGDGGTGDLRVTAIGIGRVVSFDTDDLAILPTGEYYEVFFVAGEGDDREFISAGTFHPDEDGRSRVVLTAAVNPELSPTVWITAEPGDGDPRPTGPVVMEVTIDG